MYSLSISSLYGLVFGMARNMLAHVVFSLAKVKRHLPLSEECFCMLPLPLLDACRHIIDTLCYLLQI